MNRSSNIIEDRFYNGNQTGLLIALHFMSLTPLKLLVLNEIRSEEF